MVGKWEWTAMRVATHAFCAGVTASTSERQKAQNVTVTLYGQPVSTVI